MTSKNNKDLGDKKDIEIFAKSGGGKKKIAELRKRIVLNFFKLANDSDYQLDHFTTMQADIKFYRMLVCAESEVKALEQLLEEEEESEDS